MIGFWDIILVIAVSAIGTALAYVRAPRWKAFFLSLPIPFTISTLALDKPVSASNVTALLVLFCYTQGVRLLYTRCRLPIVLSIVLSALGYIGVSLLLAPIIPQDDLAFYITAACIFIVGILLYRFMPYRAEPSQRSLLPVYLELPIIVAVVLGLVLLKQRLGGFMTLFPMVGVVAAYEARRSLWTLCRQIPVLMMTIIPLMVASRLTYPLLGLAPSLVIGWMVYLAIFIPFTLVTWRKQAQREREQETPTIAAPAEPSS
ncbi:MAG: hypothetical protein LLG44_00115 [Chloroflexi bacterium]|nr:hypothetical protein [Chloroflexota bacterium]